MSAVMVLIQLGLGCSKVGHMTDTIAGKSSSPRGKNNLTVNYGTVLDNLRDGTITHLPPSVMEFGIKASPNYWRTTGVLLVYYWCTTDVLEYSSTVPAPAASTSSRVCEGARGGGGSPTDCRPMG
ncbi:hypothetical protein HOY80DRAFT_385521 [Tuber brumale]|nr:hypothetical protein HOY80DRAFT_385521 [Tuber brumale]